MFETAVHALLKGEVIALPTEAVYGLSADPRNVSALQQLITLKKRNPDKGLILVASEFSQLEPFIEPLSADIQDRLMATWPGPYTWIVPARLSVPSLLRGKHESLAVRISAHPVVSALCAEFGGALVSTSANPEGLPPAMSEQEVRDYFGKEVLIIAGELGGHKKPTEIRDALSNKVIRPF
jgi:L-threonylcarbamoyladenylate synthase